MRVGVVISGGSPLEGGGYSFERLVLGGLKTTIARNEYIVLDLNGYPVGDSLSRSGDVALKKKKSLIRMGSDKVLRYLSYPRRDARKLDLSRAVRSLQLDLVWYLNQGGSEIPGCPFFITIWDLQHRLQPWFPELSIPSMKWIKRDAHYKRVLPLATKVITGTETGKNEIIYFYRIPATNIIVNPFPAPTVKNGANFTPIDELQRKYSLFGNYFIYPAQFWPHKNHINLLYAMRMLIDCNKITPTLVLTGSDKGNMEHVKLKIKELALDSKVRILGFVSMEDLYGLYKHAVALVYASFFGPDNIPPLEANAIGCPVLAAKADGVVDQLQDAAIYFDPANPADIVKAMLVILEDESVTLRLIKLGLKLANERSVENYVSGIDKVISGMENIFRTWNSNSILAEI